MRITIFILFVAAAICSASGAARARPIAICDAYSQKLSEHDIRNAEFALYRFSPVASEELVRRVSIRNVDSHGELAPYTEHLPSSKTYTIYVPNGFRKLQCQLVAIELHVLLYQPEKLLLLQSVLGKCVHDVSDLNWCVALVISEAVDASTLVLDQEQQRLLKKTVDDAFDIILFHELGHIVLGHLERAVVNAKEAAKQEGDADAFALLAAILGGDGGLGMFSTFAVLAFADSNLDHGGGEHGKFICRANIVSFVMAALDAPTESIFLWAKVPNSGYLQERQKDLEVTSIITTVIGKIMSRQASSCPAVKNRNITDIVSDLELLQNEVNTVAHDAKLQNMGGAFAAYDKLMSLKLLTHEGRSVRAQLISRRLLNQTFDRMIPNSLSGAELRYLDKLLQSPDVPYSTAQDYGRLWGLKAYVTFYLAPSMPIRDMIPKMRPLLARTLYYNPEMADTYAIAAQVEVLAGNCAVARNDFVASNEFMDVTQRRAGELRATFNKLIAMLDTWQCEKVTKVFRDTYASNGRKRQPLQSSE